MRRPLFGNGFTVRMLSNDGVVDVFDTLDFTPQNKAPQAFAVTLYCWTWQLYAPAATVPAAGQPAIANMPAPSVSVKTNGGPAVVLLSHTNLDTVAQQAAQFATMAKPIKLLDRYVVRGNQQITARNLNALCSVANNMNCYIYGYFEAVGEVVPSLAFRPLQPDENLVSPFSNPPLVNDVVAADTAVEKTLHLLTDTYLDLVNIYLFVGGLALSKPVGPLGIRAVLELPTVTGLPIPVVDAHPLGFLSHPFEYQPMIAPNTTDNLIRIGIDSGDVGEVTMKAYGNFLRR